MIQESVLEALPESLGFAGRSGLEPIDKESLNGLLQI